MRVVAQRVSEASVTVDGKIVGEISRGLLLLVGVAEDDESADVTYLAEKIPNLRIFDDVDGKMNLSLLDVGAQILAVSQFTLHANTRKGRRPSFIAAARPELAEPLFNSFVQQLRDNNIEVATGVFGAMMDVRLCNDGPVTIIIDSSDRNLPRRA